MVSGTAHITQNEICLLTRCEPCCLILAKRFSNWTNFEPSDVAPPTEIQENKTYLHTTMLSYSHTVHCAFLLWPKQQHTTSDTRLFLLRSPPVVVADTSGRVIVRGQWVLEESQTSLDWFGAYDQQRCARASGNTEPGCLGFKPHWWHEMLL